MYRGKRVKDLLAILHVLYALLEEGNDVLIFHCLDYNDIRSTRQSKTARKRVLGAR